MSRAQKPGRLHWHVFSYVENSKPTLADITASLTQSCFHNPKPVTIFVDDGAVRLDVVVMALRSFYVPSREEDGERYSPGCYEFPDFLWTGWVLGSGNAPSDKFVLVRGRLRSDVNGACQDQDLRVSVPISRLRLLTKLIQQPSK